MNRLTLLHRRLRRTLLARRRPLAGLAAAVAVAAGLQAAAEPPSPKALVLTAARDIPGGTVVRSSDLTRVAFHPASVPVRGDHVRGGGGRPDDRSPGSRG